MSTAYLSNRATSTQAAKSRTGIVEDDCTFVMSAAFALNDTVKLFQLPKGAKVLDFMVAVPILDSNVSPACTIDLGDTANGAQQYVAASSKGSHFSAAYILSMAVDGLPASLRTSYSAADAFTLKIHAAPATGATTGTINAWIKYQMDDESL